MNKHHVIFFFGLGLISFFLIFSVAIIFIPESPIKLRYSFLNNEHLKRVTPQGWSFFTKNPRDSDFRIYKINNSTGNFQEISLANSQIAQAFGAKRSNRITYTYIHKIASQVEGDIWYSYRGPMDSILQKGSYENRLNKVNLKVSSSFLCGRFVVREAKPVPWTWSNKNNLYSPSKLLIFNFQCSSN